MDIVGMSAFLLTELPVRQPWLMGGFLFDNFGWWWTLVDTVKVLG
jgi:hypothetical protein